MDGTFNSIKTKSATRQRYEDFIDIENICKVWVLKPNAYDSSKTNGAVAQELWDRNNT